MGQALNAASAMNAYTLTDRATWLSFHNKGSLIIIIEGDPRLINRYDVIELNAGARCAARRSEGFAEWLVSDRWQQAIGAYQVNGQPLAQNLRAAQRPDKAVPALWIMGQRSGYFVAFSSCRLVQVHR